MHHIVRRPVVLLEVFIALAIVSIAIVPISSYPFRIYEKEVQTLVHSELTRIFEEAFFSLQSELPLHYYFEDLSHEPTVIELGEFKVDLLTLGTFSFTAKADVAQVLPKESSEKNRHKLLSCTIHLSGTGKYAENLSPAKYFLHISTTS